MKYLTNPLVLLFISFATVGCDSTFITNAQEGLVADFETTKASTIRVTGFLREDSSEAYSPENRDKTYDTLLPSNLYLSENQVKPFVLGWFAYPQELNHITEILGVAHSEVGSDLYWRITSSTDLVATVDGYTVTQIYICDGFSCIPTN